MKPSALRRKIIWHAASDAVYKSKGAAYNDNMNPYSSDLVSWRRFVKAYRSLNERYAQCESLFNDLKLVYGDF